MFTPQVRKKSKEEAAYFFSKLNKDQIVLEWGSGDSTVQIGKRVKRLYSIEHDIKWCNIVKARKGSNVNLYLIKVDKYDRIADGDVEFKEYARFPLKIKEKFDIILIDGRARYECSKIAYQISDEDTMVFIHDFTIPPMKGRENYIKILDYFDIAEHYETLVFLKKKMRKIER